MRTHVFVALVEVVPNEPDALGEGIVGGFVRCYVSATNEATAKKAMESALEEAGVRTVDIEWCVREDEVDWEDPLDVDGRALVAEARSTGQTALGEFHVWSDNDSEDD